MGFGVDVLCIDLLIWNEFGVVVEVNFGKCCVCFDLYDLVDCGVFEVCFVEVDVFVYGYCCDVFEWFGYGVV